MIDNGVVRGATVAGAAAIVAVAALLAGGAAAVERTADMCVLASAVAVMCAGVFWYVHWHVTEDSSMAWLVTVAGAHSLQKLNWYTMLIGGSAAARDSVWVYLFQVGVAAGLGTMLVRGDRLPVRWDPLALGLVTGIAVILLRAAVLALPAPTLSTAGYLAVLACLGAVGLWTAVRLIRSSVLTADLRSRIAVACVFLTIGQVSVVAGSPSVLLWVSAVSNVAGSALLLSTAATRARAAVADESSALRVLRSRLDAVDHERHHGQARLHEIRATLAGITTATELQQRAEISPQRRTQLHQMMLAELQRLGRLVSNVESGPPEPTELDAALRPVIVRHEAAGLPVRWRPSGTVALTRADDVAEIVNILLSNAARHAAGEPVEVEVLAGDDEVVVAVADSGPGIDPEVRPDLFTWGVRSPRSPGEGVGLAAARMLAEDLGGRLELVPDPGSGARFALSLPAPVPAVALGVGR